MILGPGTAEGHPNTLCHVLANPRAPEPCRVYWESFIAQNDKKPWQESLDGQLRVRSKLELDYQLDLAPLRGRGGFGRRGARARTVDCERATASAGMRHEWSNFLRRAYLLKAFQEGRLPANAHERPSVVVLPRINWVRRANARRTSSGRSERFVHRSQRTDC
jgi:hypothetical protein